MNYIKVGNSKNVNTFNFDTNLAILEKNNESFNLSNSNDFDIIVW